MVVETLLGILGAALAGAAGKSASDKVVRAITERTPIAIDVSAEMDSHASFGARMADRVAQIGGSWSFVIGFCLFLVVWALLNAAILPPGGRFDPYPFIFLNLLLSMLAAIQAPIIMMSQNRQSEKDRAESRHDYEVNLKAELEIMTLHAKVDELQRVNTEQFAELRRLLTPPPLNT